MLNPPRRPFVGAGGSHKDSGHRESAVTSAARAVSDLAYPAMGQSLTYRMVRERGPSIQWLTMTS